MTTLGTTAKTTRRPVRKASPKTAPATVAKPLVQAPAKAPVKAPVKAAKPATAPTPAPKEKKLKVVRDSYTIPKAEYTQLGELKKRALSLGLSAKKSELLRAGLMLLSQQSDTQLKASLGKVPAIKTGRPAKA